MKQRSLLTSVGGLGAAILGSACCWLPLLLLTLGAGASAAGAVTNTIEKFRPVFAVVAIGLVGAAFYFTYFRRPASAPGESCCAPQPAEKEGTSKKEPLCSCCGAKGKWVPSATVHALVREPLKPQVASSEYALCLNPGCAQVYTASNGGPHLVKSDLAVRVGYKEREAPHLVCYCFEHSVEDIESELRASGKTTIPGRIKAEIQAGRCACDVENPQGACCLGNVNRAVKVSRERIAGAATAPVGAPAIQCAPPLPQEDHASCCRLPAASGPAPTFAARLNLVNNFLLPVVSVLILAMIFFPHRVFAFLAKQESTTPTPAVIDSHSKTVVLSVPGMT